MFFNKKITTFSCLNMCNIARVKQTLFFLVGKRDGKAIINSHIQSEGTGVRTPVITSSLTILTFLPVEL